MRVGLPVSEYFTCPLCRWKLIPTRDFGDSPKFLCRQCTLEARRREVTQHIETNEDDAA